MAKMIVGHSSHSAVGIVSADELVAAVAGDRVPDVSGRFGNFDSHSRILAPQPFNDEMRQIQSIESVNRCHPAENQIEDFDDLLAAELRHGSGRQNANSGAGIEWLKQIR